jgi:hypothetical protein
MRLTGSFQETGSQYLCMVKREITKYRLKAVYLVWDRSLFSCLLSIVPNDRSLHSTGCNIALTFCTLARGLIARHAIIGASTASMASALKQSNNGI